MSVQLDKLQAILLSSGVQRDNNALYQVVSNLIGSTKQLQSQLLALLSQNSGSITSLLQAGLLTTDDELALFPNSRELVGGSNITYSDSTPGQRSTNLSDTAVTAGTYGDATHVPQVTVDAKGRITLAAPVAITAGSGDWDFTITKSADQDVTNSATLVSDTELTRSLGIAECWYIQLLINYQTQDSGFSSAYKFALAFPTSTTGSVNYIVPTAASTVANTSLHLNTASSIPAQPAISHSALGVPEGIMINMIIANNSGSAGSVTYQFACNSASGAGHIARTAKGSIMRGRKLS